MLISFLLSGFLLYFWRAVIGLWGLGESNALEVARQLQAKAKLVLEFINDKLMITIMMIMMLEFI